MRKILIATHGNLADGIKSSINFLCGEQQHVYYMNAYVENFDLDSSIEHFFKGVSPGDEVVIFTDILGGSITQKFHPVVAGAANVYLVAGFNLAIILDLVIDGSELSEIKLKQKIIESRKQLVLVEEIDLENKDSEDTFFD